MTSKELKEKLEAAEAKVTKIEGTIERHKKQADKKLQNIKNNGWELDRYQYAGGNNYDAYWAICEYENKLEDIQSAERKLQDAKIVVNNWKEKLEKQLKFEMTYENEMPEIFKQCKEDLSNEWTTADLKAKAVMLKKRQELSYKEFREIYKYSREQELNKTESEFKKANERDAEIFIVDLYNRVKAITGKVTDWGNIHYGGKALNGWIVGEDGKAKVETIGAGGYNIQRYHLRVLVNQI